MIREVEELIAAIRLRLDALEISGRQAARMVSQQLSEISVRSEETAGDFHQCNDHAGEVARTLSWHATMAKRMLFLLGKKSDS